MNYLQIYLVSKVAKVAEKAIVELGRLNQLCKEKDVYITFYEDKVKVDGFRVRTQKIPAYICNDEKELCNWIRKRIETAWN